MRHPSNDVNAAIERAMALHHGIAKDLSPADYDDWAGQLILDLASGMTGFREVFEDLDMDADQVARAIADGVAQDIRLDQRLGAGPCPGDDDAAVEIDPALTAEIEAMESARGLPSANTLPSGNGDGHVPAGSQLHNGGKL